jgi:hypothetical protein
MVISRRPTSIMLLGGKGLPDLFAREKTCRNVRVILHTDLGSTLPRIEVEDPRKRKLDVAQS